MKVDNVAFLLDRLGQDCAPLQFLRELTQNSIEAIERTGAGGSIAWDVDWHAYDLSNTKTMKLTIIDTGDGMTPEEMQEFINQLSSSGAVQSMTANFGIGAKIAAATTNPAGVIYQSWKNGDGFMIQLEKDTQSGEYGLRQWELADGSYAHFLPLDDEVKPDEIEIHGTKVILCGASDTENTMVAPKGAASPSRWFTKYINTRYFAFPEGVTVRAREGWEHPREDKDRNNLRTLTGQKQYLDKHSTASGVHELESARVHWWILKDEPARNNNSGFIESSGHAAALYQNELYDRATARAGTARLQNFGILFGMQFVVLYIEPLPGGDVLLTTNTARTTLLQGGETLPWSDWAYEFRQNMPKELAVFVNKKAGSSEKKDHLKTIKDRLASIMDLYKVSRYRPMPQGTYLSDESTSVNSGQSFASGRKSKGGGGVGSAVGSTAKGARDGETGNIYHLFQKKGGKESERTHSDPFPIVRWVSVKDGTREEGYMADRAAKYLQDQNTLFVNADFRVFQDMIERLSSPKSKDFGQGIRSVVENTVHAWFEQALIETVIGVQQLKDSKEWTPNAISEALSEEALTTAVMQRYHIHNACRRELGSKLGKATLEDLGA